MKNAILKIVCAVVAFINWGVMGVEIFANGMDKKVSPPILANWRAFTRYFFFLFRVLMPIKTIKPMTANTIGSAVRA